MRFGGRTDRGPSASQVPAARPHKPRLDRDRAEPHRLRHAVRRRRGAQGGASRPMPTAPRPMWTQRLCCSCLALTALTQIFAARGLGRGRLRRLGIVCGRISRPGSGQPAACIPVTTTVPRAPISRGLRPRLWPRSTPPKRMLYSPAEPTVVSYPILRLFTGVYPLCSRNPRSRTPA